MRPDNLAKVVAMFGEVHLIWFRPVSSASESACRLSSWQLSQLGSVSRSLI